RSGTLAMRPTISLSEGWPAITRSVTAALRVVAHLAEVSGARACAELGEHGVIGRLGLLGHDLGGLVVDIAEGDGARRAGLLAGGLDGAVGDWLVGDVAADPRLGDALHAIGAFFHDAAFTHRHVRVHQEAQGRGLADILVVVEEVEAADLVGAVLRAVARADAAVVDLCVETIVRVHGGVDRADDLAGRIFALHAGHRLERCFRRIDVAGIIAVDAQPVHVVAAIDLVDADDRRIVLRHAGTDTGHAADARGEVDAHAPGFVRVVPLRHDPRLLFGNGRRSRPFGERDLVDEVATLHRVVVLYGHQPPALAGLADDQRTGLSEQRIGVGAHRIAVAIGAAPAEGDDDGIL